MKEKILALIAVIAFALVFAGNAFGALHYQVALDYNHLYHVDNGDNANYYTRNYLLPYRDVNTTDVIDYNFTLRNVSYDDKGTSDPLDDENIDITNVTISATGWDAFWYGRIPEEFNTNFFRSESKSFHVSYPPEGPPPRTDYAPRNYPIEIEIQFPDNSYQSFTEVDANLINPFYVPTIKNFSMGVKFKDITVTGKRINFDLNVYNNKNSEVYLNYYRIYCGIASVGVERGFFHRSDRWRCSGPENEFQCDVVFPTSCDFNSQTLPGSTCGGATVNPGDLDTNVFHNVNYFNFDRNVNRNYYHFTQLNENKVISDNVLIDDTGGRFVCSAWICFTNNINTTRCGSPYDPMTYDGNYTPYPHSNIFFPKGIPVQGHDAIVGPGFGSGQIYIQPDADYNIYVPVYNLSPQPWDWNGDGGENTLYVDVNILDDTFAVIDSQRKTITDLQASQYDIGTKTFLTDSNKTYVFPFKMGEKYSTFLKLSSIVTRVTTLHNGNYWLYDRKIINPKIERLIMIRHPAVPRELCITPEGGAAYCWTNVLDYGEVDLNRNNITEFDIKLQSPLDINDMYNLISLPEKPSLPDITFDSQQKLVPQFNKTTGKYGFTFGKLYVDARNVRDSNGHYMVRSASNTYPYVYDDLNLNFNFFTNNLKITKFELIPNNQYFGMDENIGFIVEVKNTGDKPAIADLNVYTTINELVFGPSSVPLLNPGETTTFECNPTASPPCALPKPSLHSLYFVYAQVKVLPTESDKTDNFKSLWFIVKAKSLSPLPEADITTVFVVLILISVLLIGVKRK